MIEVNAGRTYYAPLNNAPVGLGFNLTLGLERVDGTDIQASSSVGVIEDSPGNYIATRIAPMQPGEYRLVWFDEVSLTTVIEELTVSVAGLIEAGLYYASPDNVRSYMGISEDDLSDADLIRPIRMAQRDIDTGCGAWDAHTDTGLKFASQTTPVLNAQETNLLVEATCAQVEYRLTMGDQFMVRDQYESESGSDVSTQGTLRKLAPTAYSELHKAGLLRLGGGRAGNSVWDLPRAN